MSEQGSEHPKRNAPTQHQIATQTISSGQESYQEVAHTRAILRVLDVYLNTWGELNQVCEHTERAFWVAKKHA